MSKITLLGIASIVGAGLLFGFQGISMFMDTKTAWNNVCLVDMLSPEAIDWVDNLSSHLAYSTADFLITTPLYIMLFCIGVVLLVLGSFLWK
jgi:hypothetical protein